MPIDYSKFDAIVDSSDEEAEPSGRKNVPEPEQNSAPSDAVRGGDEGQMVTINAGFVILAMTRDDPHVPVYINVCSSDKVRAVDVEAIRSDAALRNPGEVQMNFPYIVNSARDGEDEKGPCKIVEALFHQDTLGLAAEHKRAQEALIETALAVVSDEAVPLRPRKWSIYENEAVRETNGTYFFLPEKLKRGLSLAQPEEEATAAPAASPGCETAKLKDTATSS